MSRGLIVAALVVLGAVAGVYFAMMRAPDDDSVATPDARRRNATPELSGSGESFGGTGGSGSGSTAPVDTGAARAEGRRPDAAPPPPVSPEAAARLAEAQGKIVEQVRDCLPMGAYVEVKATITASGGTATTSNVTIRRSSRGDAVSKCVREKLEGVTYPTTEPDGTFEIAFPMKF